MSFQECQSADENDVRQRHCGDINRRKRCSSSMSSSCNYQNEMHRESIEGFQNRHHQYGRSIPTPSTIEDDLTVEFQVGNRRRTRSHRPHPLLSIRNFSYTHNKFLLIILLLLDYITLSKQQGITFGGVLNLDRCYNAMQISQIDNRISRSQYVTFIQELANNQFQSFQLDAETNTYGNFPTTDFNSFPEQIRQEFNRFACGGINFICDEAYLYTDGTAPDDPVPDPQQEVYLYQVCEGVESAIEDTLPKTMKPTNSPTGAVVKGAVLLDYQITVPSFITEGGIMDGDNDESEEVKEALLVAMQDWAQNAVNELTETGPTSRKLQRQKYERVLAIALDPNEIEFTNVANAVCNVEPIQFRDKCLDIQMVVPLELTEEHSLTPEEIKAILRAKFEESLRDGSFYASLSPEVLEYISAITPPKAPTEIPSPPPTPQTPISPIPPTEVANPQIPGAKAPIPAPSPEGGGNSSIIGIATGVSVGLIVVIAGFFIFRRRQAQKRRYDNTDSTPSFGKRRSTDSGNYMGFFSAFTPKKKDIQDDDLEWGHDDSSDDSGSMESYSSHSSSGSDSSSYYSTSDGTSGTGGPASVSASSASSYDTHPEDIVPHVNRSMTSGKSSSSSERDLTTRPKLYDFNDSEGSRSDPLSSGGSSKNTTGRDRTDSEADDSSAGSSGWESSDGDSSVHSGSVESFDANTETLGTSVSTSQDGAYQDEEMQDRELQPDSMNPALNPVVQRGVTMVPVSEENEDNGEESTNSSDDSDSRLKIRDDTAPLAKDLDKAIEAGDWAAVGETAAILASDSDRDDESAMKSSSSKSGSHYSSGVSASTGYSGETDESGIVAAHAAEIDHLVESGNWDGVVAVAARYADDASMTSAAKRPPTKDDDHSDASASLDSASIMTGTTRGSGESKGSVLLSRVGSNSLLSNAGSSKGSSGNTPDDDMGTHASSITSSYVSRSGITTSMVSNASSLSDEKQQMNMYRAEVEALVRRVVPDEIDNIDDIMVQFSGREEELIETLKAMQEKSIAQRARAAVQRTAKREKGVLGRSTEDSSEDNSESHGGSVDNRTMSSNQSSKSSNYSSEYTSSGGGDSITSDFAGLSHRSSYTNSVASSYSSRGTSHSGDSGYSTHSGHSDERTNDDSYVTGGGDDDATSSLSAAVDASDWRAMGTPAEMLGEKTTSGKDPLDELLRGGPGEADRASGKF